MSDWKKEPFKIEFKKGENVAFCGCDNTKNAPYCDGSHKTPSFGDGPYYISFEKDETVFACGCKTSSTRPYCDGSHKQLSKSTEDKENNENDYLNGSRRLHQNPFFDPPFW